VKYELEMIMFLKVKSVDYDDDSSGDFDLLIQ